jgi:putative membrane protein
MGAMMIKHYTDHAANERTFLAWIRTGITITVFGFVIEKFELFVEDLPRPAVSEALIRAFPESQIELVSLLFVMTGIGVILLSAWHFVKTRRAIESNDDVAYHDLLPTSVLSGLLTLAGFILLLALFRIV